MNKTYPVVLYPSKILRFLAQNPPLISTKPFVQGYENKSVPSFGSGESRVSDGNFSQLSKEHLHPTLHALKPNLKWQYLLLFMFGTLIVLSLAFLSPPWLVTAIWGMIFMGIWGIVCPDLRNYKKYQRQRPKAFTQEKTQATLRFPTRERQISSLLSGSVITSIGRGTGNVQVGVSENAFKEVLQLIFPNIVQGLQFPNPAFSIPYSADFALIHPSGLSIDIEVDEPYVGNTKQPHHCSDSGKDSIRNQFFTAGNWVVIRFSEKQVVLYPKSCCKVIAAVVASVTGDYTYLAQLTGIPELPPDPMWGTRQAKKWAKQDYRKTYLPKRGK